MTLAEIQLQLKAPKNNRNEFAKYNYRSAEDIIEAAKALICPDGWFLNLTDEVVCVGNHNYIKATASIRKYIQYAVNEPYTLIEYSAVGWAREEETRKGMDASQITGSSSSYARKYALNGLFAIDDTKDADTMPPKEIEETPLQIAIMSLRNIQTLDELKMFWTANKQFQKEKSFIEAKDNRKKQIEENLNQQ